MQLLEARRTGGAMSDKPKPEPLPYDILPNGACRRNAVGYARIKAILASPKFRQSMAALMRKQKP